MQEEMREPYRDKIRGSLLGGAVGDALGYPVEFFSWSEIQRTYGPAGIQDYTLDNETGFALISDDTQMTLFTADGILFRSTRGHLRGIAGEPSSYVYSAYLNWLITQGVKGREPDYRSWLLDVPELYRRRAPGNTCLSALHSGRCGTIDDPINNSKGCGGVMRVAPLALWDRQGPEHRDWLVREGARLAAITHGHPLGWLPAAVLTCILNTAVYGKCARGNTLADAVAEALEETGRQFGQEPEFDTLRTLVEKAAALSQNGAGDAENIRRLGEGWVAEETLAIAVYCSLRYSDSFSRGVTAAVNHSGDSDSTGAVAGNILGAWLGCEAVEKRWRNRLELAGVILELADDLCGDCPLTGARRGEDPAWESKYIQGRRPGCPPEELSC